MFNFFDEIKKKVGNNKIFEDYNVILASGRLLYIEGHCGLLIIRNDLMVLKVKNAKLEICGNNLSINELTENTILIEGNICEVKRE